jgi:hypothetical protein
MATAPRWVDRVSTIIPIDSMSGMTKMRLQEAVQYAAEAEKEAEAARDHAAKLTEIADRAAEQREYWGRIAEIAMQVDLRLAAEGEVEVTGAVVDEVVAPAAPDGLPPF